MSQRGQSRRWQSVTLIASLAALLVGCSLPPLPWQQQTHGPAPLPDAQQIAHVALAENGDAGRMLDPASANYFDPGEAQILSLLYSGLFTFDARLRPVPALAASYSVSADGLRYTIHLRSGARFAEGTPLTSADVAFSLDRAMSGCAVYAPFAFFDVKDQPALTEMCRGGPPQGQRAVTTLIGDSLLTPDVGTLVIILSRPDGALISKLTEPYSFILERSFVTRYGPSYNSQWTAHLADGGGQGTSGMYAVTALKPWGPRTDGSLTLKMSPNYWGQRPRLRQVVVALRNAIPAPLTAETTPTPPGYPPPDLFPVTSTDDIVFDVWQPWLSGAASVKKSLTALSFPALPTTYITLDPNVAPLDDARLRHALALALDKTQLTKIIRGAIPTNHLIPPGTGDYPATLSGPSANAPLAGNVAQAQALWQSYVQDRCGGVASRCPVVTVFELGAIAWPSPLELAVMARWRATLPGLRLEQVQIPGTLIVSWPPPTAANDVYLFEDYPDPQDWWLSYATMPGYSQSADGNNPLVHEPQTDALVARAEATLDPTARLALYQQAENTLLNDAVVVPIAQQQDTWEVKPSVSGIPANPAPWIAPSVWARIYLTAPAAK